MKRAVMRGVFVSVTVLGWLGTVLAGNSNEPRIHARIERQQERIYSGISSGALTPREAHWFRHGPQSGSL